VSNLGERNLWKPIVFMMAVGAVGCGLVFKGCVYLLDRAHIRIEWRKE
jgi:uncharacterized protein (DUF2062 family)